MSPRHLWKTFGWEAGLPWVHQHDRTRGLRRAGFRVPCGGLPGFQHVHFVRLLLPHPGCGARVISLNAQARLPSFHCCSPMRSRLSVSAPRSPRAKTPKVIEPFRRLRLVRPEGLQQFHRREGQCLQERQPPSCSGFVQPRCQRRLPRNSSHSFSPLCSPSAWREGAREISMSQSFAVQIPVGP